MRRKKRSVIHPQTRRRHVPPASPCKAETILRNPRRSATAVPEHRHCPYPHRRQRNDRKGRRCTCHLETIAESAHVRIGSAGGFRRSSAFQIHKSLRKRLCCQSESTVAITAAEPSGDSFASLTSVAFMNSSSVISSWFGAAQLQGYRPARPRQEAKRRESFPAIVCFLSMWLANLVAQAPGVEALY